jgi:peptide/nickel transport system permease protein
MAYLRDLLTLNFGTSFQTMKPVREDVVRFFPATAELALLSMVVYVSLSIPLGIWCATSRAKGPDVMIRLLTMVGSAAPGFWLGLILQFVFYAKLRWLPAVGRLDTALVPPPTITGMLAIDSLLDANWPTLLSALKHLVLPVTACVIVRLSAGVKITRAALGDILLTDYIRTARSKGLSEKVVLFRHALRNALIPIVTAMGMQFGALLGGTIVTEVVFGWPGMGRYAANAIYALDFPAIMSATAILSVVFVTVNLLVDLLYVLIDPRVRLG